MISNITWAKKRARKWAFQNNKQICWILAKDTPAHTHLQERPYTETDKKRWLQYHDKNCDKLHGMVPVAEGMPMMLVDHLDRSPNKQLLRGRVGYVHSWVLNDSETGYSANEQEATLSHMPEVILLDFQTKEWHLAGMPGPGIYPIFPRNGTWKLDAYRKKKAVLRIKRQQFPIAPAFAITAHFAQGKAERAIISDLQACRGVAPIASYVAITRIKSREGLLIFP